MLYSEDEDPIFEKSQGDMSLDEKMRLWGRESRKYNQDVTEVDLFEGVEDDDEEAMEHPELSAYTQNIFASESYCWLLTSFLKASSFHWDGNWPRTMVDQIRRDIMKKLPTGKVSRLRDPCGFSVTFRLPWLALKERLHQEHVKRGMSAGEAIFESVVLTAASPDEIQATTVVQFLEQTWASDGRALLAVLKRVVDDPNGQLSSQIGK